jgi:nucleoside-diphosphate-sugar epimerase
MLIARRYPGRALEVVISKNACRTGPDRARPRRIDGTAVQVLVLGGTGVIGTGVVHRLLAHGASVSVFARGLRESTLPSAARFIAGDRVDRKAFERAFEHSRHDVVIDLLGYTPDDAESLVRTFGGRCEQVIFCSTVCTYGVSLPASVLVDERVLQQPTTPYAREKVACERILERAAAERRFEVTLLRPSHTYGPGGPLVDQLEIHGVAWDRIARGLPVLCAGDGLGLWQATHRDDCAELFALVAGAPRAYGEAFNATGDGIVTWRDYYRSVARSLGSSVQLVLAPAGWLLRELPGRFSFLAEITRFHAVYSSAKAKVTFPGFRTTIDLETGARETLADLRRRNAWRDSTTDHAYQALVDKAQALGFETVEA